MRTILLLLLIAGIVGVLALQAFVRLSPVDAARWHVPLRLPEEGPGDWSMPNGHRAAFVLPEAPAEAWARIEAQVLEMPRTRVLASQADEGRVTFVSRTLFWGFPDFMTLEVVPSEDGSLVRVFARQGFGGYDWGVNRARLERLRAALGA